MRTWDELVDIMRRPKPSFACSVVETAQGDVRRSADVWFDGEQTWWIDDGSVRELRADADRVLLDSGEGLTRHDAEVYVHGWVRTPLEPWRMSLDTAAGTVRELSTIEGRSCTTADVDGLRADEDATFRIWIDDETGIALRIEREDGAAAVEVRGLRIGRIET